MADNQDLEMGNGEHGQGGEDYTQDDQMNGGGENGAGDSGDGANTAGKDDDRKLFVGGLSWETSDKELRDHFGNFGEIESINVKTDPNTGRSRGFAFIVFKSPESIDKATIYFIHLTRFSGSTLHKLTITLKFYASNSEGGSTETHQVNKINSGLKKVLSSGDHVINNKKIDPKKAKAKQGKIFVGGLSTELSDDDIKNYFAQYGTIVEVEMPYDKTKSQRKGYCFITFESEQIVTELLKTPKQIINGKEVDVKKATPKPDGMGGIRGGRGGRGGRGRGRGGFGQGGYAQSGYGNYSGGYGSGGYGDYYGSGYGNYGGGYGGYDYSGYGGYGGSGYDSYGSGYGNSYDAGYAATGRGGGGRGGKGSSYGGGKQRGGGRGQRHAPY